MGAEYTVASMGIKSDVSKAVSKTHTSHPVLLAVHIKAILSPLSPSDNHQVIDTLQGRIEQ